MSKWVREVSESLSEAIEASANGNIPKLNLYMLAPLIYSKRQETNNEALIQEMIDTTDEQFKIDCSFDVNSKYQYKFHFVSSYLYCFVVAGKIDDFKYDRLMAEVTSSMKLFEEGYEPE